MDTTPDMQTTERTPGRGVIVGVDDTPSGHHALLWAVDYARANHRPLTIVHAGGEVDAGNPFIEVEKETRERLAEATRIADAALAEARTIAPDVEATTWVELAEPAELLLAASHAADMVVLGARRRVRLVGFLLGSLSSTVTRKSACPVTVVRPAPSTGRSEPLPVVVGVDADPTSMAALDVAFDLASWQDRPLHVLHSYADLPRITDWRHELPVLDSEEKHQVYVAEAVAGRSERYPDVKVTRSIVRMDAVPTLVEASESAAVVVVGGRRLDEAQAVLFGSVSRAVARRGHCTVVIVPEHSRELPRMSRQERARRRAART